MFAPWEIFHVFFLSSADCFHNQLFRKLLSGIQPKCQTDWIQIRPNILSVLFWVQSVCKDYEQMTLEDKDLKYLALFALKKSIFVLSSAAVFFLL